MISKIKHLFIGGHNRSNNVTKNIGLSLIAKASNILCSLLIVPITIDYLNPTRYGIWMTLSSIIGWILFFDLGLGNGLRNHFVKARAANDSLLCRQYVSTAYCAIFFIVMILGIVGLVINNYLYWPGILNVQSSYSSELRSVVTIVLSFTSLNMVVNLFTVILTADLRPGLSSIISSVGQWLVLLGIILLKRTTNGNLEYLAFIYSGIPCLTILITSIVMFRFSRYKIYRPSFSFFKKTLLRNIFSLGIQFFVIYICLILIFQIINLVISREIGLIEVTKYNIVNKYFSIFYMVANIVMLPIWSAVTDAYAKKDWYWIKELNKKLSMFFITALVGNLFLLLISPYVYKIWIGNKVQIPYSLSITMTIYISCQILGTIYINIINGLGTIRLQLIIYVFFALISLPLFTCAARLWGLNGIVLVPALVCLVQGIFAKIQVSKIISQTAKGIWIK